MSIKNDIDVIINLTPVLREPTSEELSNVRRILRREPARRLRNMRTVLESVVLNGAANPSKRWTAAQAQVGNLSGLSDILRRWKVLNRWAGERLRDWRHA